MKKELIFLGPPACGKGTQTNRLSEFLGFPHVDTGSLLRAVLACCSAVFVINAGSVNVATTPMIANVIRTSARVKPFFFIIVFLSLLIFELRLYSSHLQSF